MVCILCAMKTEKIDPQDLKKAVNLILQGEIVAFPTETVYGLGASIFLEEAIQKIFFAKGRPSDNPLIAHVCDLFSIEKIAQNIPEVFYRLAEQFFPGPLTLVLPKGKEVPSIVSAGLDTVAVRMPNHPIAKELIRLVGTPLVAPSANLSGKPSSTQVSHVLDDFEGKIAGVILGDSSEIGIESTVISLLNNEVEILRPGSISQEEVEEFLRRKISVFTSQGKDGRFPSPGMKYKHYAPLAQVSLFFSEQEALNSYYGKNLHHKKMILANGFFKEEVFPLKASSFYSKLRLADEKEYQEVLIVCDPITLQNKGFMNRIEKAAGL